MHAIQPVVVTNRPAVPPIYQSAAWEFATLEEAVAIFDGRVPGTTYGTNGAPNVVALERAIAELESAESAVVTSGGMSALFAVLFAQLQPGDCVVAANDLFGMTAQVLRSLEKWNVRTAFVDTHAIGDVAAALDSERARVVLVETISNPRMRVANIPALAGETRRCGALLVVDNTFATPFHCQPLLEGADIVIESVTKALAGHFDVVTGAVAGRRDLLDPVRTCAVQSGMIPSPFDAWLAGRGLVTFAVRQQKASETARRLAEWLDAQRGIRAVHYPGLPTHLDHAIASRLLLRGSGAMISFELDAGADINRFLGGLRLLKLVHSLGGPTTTLSHSQTMTHRSEEMRARLGLHEGFFRLSVGLEAPEDLIEDLSNGLAHAY